MYGCGVFKINTLGAYYGYQYAAIDHFGRVAIGVVVDRGQTTGQYGASNFALCSRFIGGLNGRSIGGAIDATKTVIG